MKMTKMMMTMMTPLAIPKMIKLMIRKKMMTKKKMKTKKKMMKMKKQNASKPGKINIKNSGKNLEKISNLE